MFGLSDLFDELSKVLEIRQPAPQRMVRTDLSDEMTVVLRDDG